MEPINLLQIFPLLIDSTKPTSQKYIWSACRPKKGSATKYSLKNNNNDDLNSTDENSMFVERVAELYERFIYNTRKASKAKKSRVK